MLPTTPSKRAHIDDLREVTSNTRPDIVPEDLTIALQNLGSRVRKSVTEGYNPHQLGTFTVPPTPCSSPAKLPSTQTTPTPIFRSASDAFISVFPAGGLRVPLTPSPRKRRRQEELVGGDSHRVRDSDVEMGPESEVDDDPVTVILGPDANSNVFSLPREIKPLRRSVAQDRSGAVVSQPFSLTSQDVGTPSASLDTVQNEGVQMDFSHEITD